jgi:hypothetical protein
MRSPHYSSLTCLLVAVYAVGCSVDPPGKWKDVVSAKHKFKIKMPGDPRQESKKSPDGREIAAWDVDEGGKGMPFGMFKVMIGPTMMPNKVADKEVFDRLRDAFIKRFNAKLVKESDFTRQEKTVGRHIELEISEGSRKVRTVFIVNNDLVYQLTVDGDRSWNGWGKADRFFDSFEFLP